MVFFRYEASELSPRVVIYWCSKVRKKVVNVKYSFECTTLTWRLLKSWPEYKDLSTLFRTRQEPSIFFRGDSRVTKHTNTISSDLISNLSLMVEWLRSLFEHKQIASFHLSECTILCLAIMRPLWLTDWQTESVMYSGKWAATKTTCDWPAISTRCF